MGKASNSKRRGRENGGCMWGLMNLFNFRRVQAGNKLITSRKKAEKNSSSGRHKNSDRKEESVRIRSNGSTKGIRRRSKSCDIDSDANSHEVKRSAKSLDFDEMASKNGESTKFFLLSELKKILTKKSQINDHFFSKRYLTPEMKMEDDKFDKIYAEARKHIFNVLNSEDRTSKDEDATFPFIHKQEERPSPVSVLEACCLEEEEASPLSTVDASMATEIAPLRIDFEESIEENEADRVTEVRILEGEEATPIAIEIAPLRNDCGSSREEEQECTVPDLVTYLLESAEIEWGEFSLKSYACDRAIDPAIMEKDIFGEMEDLEKKNLVDCVNEVIAEIWKRYTMKPMTNIKPVIREIRERVNWHHKRIPPSCSLDQMVKKDVAKPGLWMDLEEDASLLAAEIGESVLNDLVEDLTLTL